MTQSERLSQAIDAHPPKGKSLPVFFNGIEGFRYLGRATTPRKADDLLMKILHVTPANLSATKMSHVEVLSTKQQCFVAHC